VIITLHEFHVIFPPSIRFKKKNTPSINIKMPPNQGLVHLKEYDIKDSNVELIGSDIDHQVKYKSAATEPAWNDGQVGKSPTLRIWRIENFEVVLWPKEKYGQFHEGDSYIVLYSYKANNSTGQEKLNHEIFFWLGSKTSQDEAGTAAYKTVELDEFLHGVATQHREVQQSPSAEFVTLFPRLKILSGGIQSGFNHVDMDKKPEEVLVLLRIFKPDGARRADSIVVHEVEPTWKSLDDNDVFVLDKGDKIWIWQGKNCSPMEKAKSAQVVNDMVIAKHVNVEVLSQSEPRSNVIVSLLGGRDIASTSFQSPRPMHSVQKSVGTDGSLRSRKLFRISDSSGQISLDEVKKNQPVQKSDLDTNDIFLLDASSSIWIWEGANASKGEKTSWMKVVQRYIRQLQDTSEGSEAYRIPFSKVVQHNESPNFFKALEV